MKDLKPNYFDKFICIGHKCPDTCCQGWSIDVDQKSHKKYEILNDSFRKNNNISKFLKKKPYPNTHNYSQIEMKKNGLCPFLDINKLCKIQSKLGEDYLPNTCKVFPRRMVDFNEIKVKTLSLACPEAARLCLTKKNSMEIKLEDKKKNFIKIVPDHLHNPFTIVGEKLFNKIFFLFKDEKFKVENLLIICENLLNEQKNLEKNPSKIDQVTNFIIEKSKKLDFFNIDNSIIKLNFLNDITSFIQKNNPKSSLNKILNETQKKLISNFTNYEEAIENFKNIEKNEYISFEKKNYSILRNFFLNEILGNVQIFTNQTLNCRNRFYLIILCATISKIITIGDITKRSRKNIDKNILTNAIQKVIKNFGAFIKVDNNQEYIFHPEINKALEKVEKNNIFNSLFLLFCSIG